MGNNRRPTFQLSQTRISEGLRRRESPINPPLLPMLAKRLGEIPSSPGWVFEPKWDGFRALIFRDGGEILIQSRDEKFLNRYFPELIDSIREQLPIRCVLDGEIVIAAPGGLDFEALQLRIHPAASRVKLLSRQIPASLVFFDLLALADSDLTDQPFEKRRSQLVAVLASTTPPIHLTPATRDHLVAADWFRRFEGAGLDGIIAKSVSLPYQPDKRSMLKVKHERDCDCVVAGFRWYTNAEQIAVDPFCWAYTTTILSSMLVYAPASLKLNAASLWNFLALTARVRSTITRGVHE